MVHVHEQGKWKLKWKGRWKRAPQADKSMLYNVMLKGHSHLCDHADLDTSFVSLKSVYLNRLRRLK